MSNRKIQEQFGQVFIDAMAEFAKKDIKSTTDLENDEFSHVQNAVLKRALSETLYGTLTSSPNGMRSKRNTVHLTNKIISGVTYWAGFAKRSHTTMYHLITQTKGWLNV